MQDDIWLMQGDCLERMKEIPDGSVDMVLTDPPYGTTSCSWDIVIDLAKMWEQLKRIVKLNGNIVLFGSQPFTSNLIMSNPKLFKYEIIWDKPQSNNPFIVKRQIRRHHENILIFYKNSSSQFYPIMEEGKPYSGYSGEDINHDKIFGDMKSIHNENMGTRYPKSIIKFSTERKRLHPTQKPVALMEYLIKTYTVEGNIIVDFTMGSGSTGVAAKNTNRKFIGIELDETYFNIAKERIEQHNPLDEFF